MSLEPENRLATPLKVPPPTRTFAINPLNYQASAAVAAVPWAAPRGRESCWVDLGRCKCDSGTVANSPISCWPLCDGRVDWFRAPTAALAQASRGGQSGLLGGAASLLRPGYPSLRYSAPAQPRASFVCRFPYHNPAPPLHGFTARKREKRPRP